MKRKLKVMLSLMLLLTLVLSQVAYAKSSNDNGNNNGNGNAYGKEHAPGQLKKLEGVNPFQVKVKVRNSFVKFDVPPVLNLKNKTLIPARAVSEALGCDVYWISPLAIIVSPDGESVLAFDLEQDNIYKMSVVELDAFLGMDIEKLKDIEAIETLDLANNFWSNHLYLPLDTEFGLINNRTFLPLRFIAEEFGLSVSYDKNNGEICIDEKPVLEPKSVSYSTSDQVAEVINVFIPTNAYTFTGIENMTNPEDFKIVSTTSAGLTIAISTDNLVLDEEATELRFEFNYEKEINGVVVKDTIYREFKILIVDTTQVLPTIDPNVITVDLSSIVEKVVTIDSNGYDFLYALTDDILIKDVDYVKDGNMFTFSEDFLSTLTVADEDIKFVFSKDGEFFIVKLDLELVN